jgi:hypothetical protein
MPSIAAPNHARRSRGTAERADPAPWPARHPLAGALLPLAVDIALPLGLYYGLSKGAGVSTVPALIASSAPPALSALWTAVVRRRANGLAAVMLAVNLAGIAVSSLTGDPRLMLAKDGAVSSVIGIAILVSVAAGRPLMSAALRPVLGKGDRGRMAAWDRLAATSPAFDAAARRYSAVWGLALLGDSVARVVCAYTLPVHTAVWLHSVLLLGAVAVAAVGSGPFTRRLDALVRRETAWAE